MLSVGSSSAVYRPFEALQTVLVVPWRLGRVPSPCAPLGYATPLFCMPSCPIPAGQELQHAVLLKRGRFDGGRGPLWWWLWYCVGCATAQAAGHSMTYAVSWRVACYAAQAAHSRVKWFRYLHVCNSLLYCFCTCTGTRSTVGQHRKRDGFCSAPGSHDTFT